MVYYVTKIFTKVSDTMKLLLCSECYDVFSLDFHLKSCTCGQTEGKYIDDINAIYAGRSAIPLGFNNLTVVEAIKKQPEKGWGEEFKAFVIPKDCPTFKRKNCD